MKRRTKPGDLGRAIGYIRVSTEEQKLGPKAQAEALESWASRESVQLLACFIDRGVSGATPIAERKALMAALATCKSANAGVLVAAKRDRLARSLAVVAAIEAEVLRSGAVLRTTDGMSDGVGSGALLSRGIADLIGAWEREVISERTRAALGVKRSRGERTGAVRYGWKVGVDGKRLEPSESEQAVIALITELRAIGFSTRAIVAELGARGVKSRAGRPLQQTQVQRILGAAVGASAAYGVNARFQ
jgi:site-specific DNA recombinase